MKQTSVEWLIERLLDLDYQFAKKLISLDVYSTTKVYLQEKAKEMEKVQIIKAYQQGVTDEHGDTITFTTEGEDYYNSTYKS
jgi:hypothetical protein